MSDDSRRAPHGAQIVVSEPARIRGIVVGHGEMARGLVDAVRRIAGDAGEALAAVSNEGKGPQELKAELDAVAGPDPVLVFADLESGSCGIAAAYACRDSSRRAVVCGVNLPMLLDFVFHRDLPLQELAARVVERGRAAIRSAPGRS
jgi:mannose/fructose-specific phosphotransferase system component IIA